MFHSGHRVIRITVCLQYGGGRNELNSRFSIWLYIFNQGDSNSIAAASQTLKRYAQCYDDPTTRQLRTEN